MVYDVSSLPEHRPEHHSLPVSSASSFNLNFSNINQAELFVKDVESEVSGSTHISYLQKVPKDGSGEEKEESSEEEDEEDAKKKKAKKVINLFYV